MHEFPWTSEAGPLKKKTMCSVNGNDIVQTVFTFTCEIKVLETQQILVPTLKNVLRRTELRATALLNSDLPVTPDHEQTTGCHKMLSILQCSWDRETLKPEPQLLGPQTGSKLQLPAAQAHSQDHAGQVQGRPCHSSQGQTSVEGPGNVHLPSPSDLNSATTSKHTD